MNLWTFIIFYSGLRVREKGKLKIKGQKIPRGFSLNFEF